MRKLLLIIGNGFTIDFINHIDKSKEIDVNNLFRLGHEVKFPVTGRPGFLSHRHCPSLWLLGARPNMSSDDSISLIEEIITCSNMLFEYLYAPGYEKLRVKLRDNNQSPYIKAYCELIAYLKYLFIGYDRKILDEELREFLEKSIWRWTNFFQKAADKNSYDEITIITYNYDIWLERILKLLEIEYVISGLSDGASSKVKIIKPHGSISFAPKSGEDKPYEINYTIETLSSAGMDEIEVKYKDMGKYDKNYLIPPLGDSSRRNQDSWAKKLREEALSAVKGLGNNDDVIICGTSYWHVDRKELDKLLINLDQGVNLMLINPEPPKELNAVLATLFESYTMYTSSETLENLIA